MMVVVAMVIMTVIIVRGRHVCTRTVAVIMMLDLVTARVPNMRADNRDCPRDEGADQRQKNDCLDHLAA
jgi:hypothetical protein